MIRLFVMLLITLQMAGCSGLQTALEELAADGRDAGQHRPPEAYLEEARQLGREGRWTEGLSLLRQAAREHPDDGEIGAMANELEQEWRDEQRIINCRLQLVESTGLIQAKVLLERLATGDPNDPIIRSRIILHEHDLQNRTADLVDCAASFEHTNLRMAKRCLLLANRIAPSEEIGVRLEEISRKIEELQEKSLARREEKAQASQARKEEKVERIKAERVRKLILEAERESRQGALTRAMPLLEEALKQDPENPEVRGLIAELQSSLENQAAVLIKLGDRLYRDEQLGPAIAVWSAALKLDPARPEITEKLERARRVYAKLESIRAGVPATEDSVDWLENP